MILNPIPAIPVILFHGNVMAAMCALLPQRDNCGMRSWRRTPTRAAAVMSAGQVQHYCTQAAAAQR
jgi:hypothetical protein